MTGVAMHLEWMTNRRAGCCFAAEGFARGLQPADARLGESLIEPCRELKAQIESSRLPARSFWQNLLALAHEAESEEVLVRLVLTNTVGLTSTSKQTVASLASILRRIDTAMTEVFPRLDDDLQHRTRPLQEHWEARGPGLLQAVARLTDHRLIADQATVVTVYPTFGGGGYANPMTHAVLFEALLANVIAGLPEVLRLGWLIAQLNEELADSNESVRRERLSELIQLALLPPILEASEAVELASLSHESLTTALAGWRINVVTTNDLPALLLDWWQTYRETKPSWDVALTALDRMLGDQLC